MAETRYTIDQAARRLGLTPDGVRKRVRRGALAHTRDGARIYVLLNGHQDLSNTVPETELDKNDTVLSDTVSNLSNTDARQQLALIRDEWLRPLVEKIGDLERENGRLEAERDQARREADELRARLETPSPVHSMEVHIAPVETHPIETHIDPTVQASTLRPWWKFWTR